MPAKSAGGCASVITLRKNLEFHDRYVKNPIDIDSRSRYSFAYATKAEVARLRYSQTSIAYRCTR